MSSMPHRVLRAFFIRKVLDRRFGVDALQQDNTDRYKEAMRERQRLEATTDVELAAMVFGDSEATARRRRSR